MTGTSEIFDYQNLTLLWWVLDGYVWIMSDDQVIAQINLAVEDANYAANQPVYPQFQVITQQAAAAAMTWHQVRLSLAHN